MSGWWAEFESAIESLQDSIAYMEEISFSGNWIAYEEAKQALKHLEEDYESYVDSLEALDETED